MKVKVGDNVKIIAGSDKGKTGKITKVLDDKVIVEGVRLCIEHHEGREQNIADCQHHHGQKLPVGVFEHSLDQLDALGIPNCLEHPEDPEGAQQSEHLEQAKGAADQVHSGQNGDQIHQGHGRERIQKI